VFLFHLLSFISSFHSSYSSYNSSLTSILLYLYPFNTIISFQLSSCISVPSHLCLSCHYSSPLSSSSSRRLCIFFHIQIMA
jgi:hypothetical protein